MRLHIFAMFLLLFVIVLIVFQQIEGFSAGGFHQATSGMNSTTLYIIVGIISGILLLSAVFKIASRRSSNNNS